MLKNIFATLKSSEEHDLPTSVKVRVISPFWEGFILPKRVSACTVHSNDSDLPRQGSIPWDQNTLLLWRLSCNHRSLPAEHTLLLGNTSPPNSRDGSLKHCLSVGGNTDVELSSP